MNNKELIQVIRKRIKSISKEDNDENTDYREGKIDALTSILFELKRMESKE